MKFLMLLAFALISMWIPTDGAVSPGEVYWKVNVGNPTAMPKVIKESLSGTGSNKIFEATKIAVTQRQPGSNVQYGYSAKSSDLPTDNSVPYFLEKDLIHPGSTMKLRVFYSAQDAKFIPSKMANSIPFSSDKLPEILHYFAVKPKSTMAELIKEAIRVCESKPMKGEERSCVTSLESMVEYTKSRVGKPVKALSTEIDKETAEDYKIASAKKIQNEKNVVCHKMGYPYAVFYCHTLSKTDAYQVSLIDATGKKIRAVAVCHKDTSPWSPGHLAFKLLKVKPGTVPVCHFLNVHTMIWVPK